MHLQLRPGTDAFLLAAMLAIIVRDGLHDREFLAAALHRLRRTSKRQLRAIPIEEFVRRADVPLADVERVARGFATARRACVRVDLGTQQTLHTHAQRVPREAALSRHRQLRSRGQQQPPLVLPADPRPHRRARQIKGKTLARTAFHGMHPIGGLYPPNILPDEILQAGEDRIRAVFVDSCNPLMTDADTAAFERAFATLELLVVVDVAMTETARLAHYVLPAASQFEKWEATGFNLEFPENYFHLRHPLFAPRGETLPEPEIYTRLLEKMGAIPQRFPVLSAVARLQPDVTHYLPYIAALGVALATHKHWVPFAASIALPHARAHAAERCGSGGGPPAAGHRIRRRNTRLLSGAPAIAATGSRSAASCSSHPRAAIGRGHEPPRVRRGLVARAQSGPPHPPRDPRDARANWTALAAESPIPVSIPSS